MKVRSGFEDLVLVGGVESMSRVPMGSDGGAWALDPETNLHTSFVPQGIGADLIATLEGFSRADVDAFALRSQQKAAKARAEGLFGKSLVPVADQNGIVLLDHDEFIRADSTLEARRAQTEFRDDGADGLRRHRAAQVQPGRAHRARAYAGQQLGDRRRRQRHAHWLRGQGPRTGPEGAGADRRYRGDLHRPHHHAYRPRAATRKALAKAGLKVEDIDLFEVNEAFASVVMKFMKDMGVAESKVNVNGGAIAMGHPLGATGCIILGTLLDELERRNLRYGLATLCVGGGMGIATIIERV